MFAFFHSITFAIALFSTVQHSNVMEYKFSNNTTKVAQLTDLIETAISNQTLKVGDSLPSINSLSKQHNISRDTVFKALLNLKDKGLIDSIHGKNYFVSNHSSSILLLLDEYSPFKEALYNTILKKLPEEYKIDLWFHQYNKKLFDTIVKESYGRYGKYIVMNYDNEKFSSSLNKISKNQLLLIDFGKFDKDGYSYVCQDFDNSFYNALLEYKEEFSKYNKLIYVLNKQYKHPQSSKDYFIKFCNDNNIDYEIQADTNGTIQRSACYIVVKQTDIVNIIKECRLNDMKMGEDYGLLAYNENPIYEIIEKGISSIGVDWKKMGCEIVDFILNNEPVETYLETKIIKRNSF